MLAELAAANAAFAVIKTAIANGKQLSELGSKVFEYFGYKNKIQEKATKKGGGEDLAEFIALEQLKRQEKELREYMIYAGRPGMWDDWVAFQAQAARRKRESKEANTRRIAKRQNELEKWIDYFVIGLAAFILAALMLYGMALYMLHLR
jgi:hypothetical protein